jgi:hypothetical protein
MYDPFIVGNILLIIVVTISWGLLRAAFRGRPKRSHVPDLWETRKRSRSKLNVSRIAAAGLDRIGR